MFLKSIFTTMKSNNITSYFEFSIFLMKRILNRKLEFPIYPHFERFVLILILPVGLKRKEISNRFLSGDQVGLKVSSDFEYDTVRSLAHVIECNRTVCEFWTLEK